MTALDEAGVMLRMAAHDPEAASELYRRFRPGMLALALRIARDRTIAEEAVQDAMVQAWRDASRYDAARGSLSTWLHVITRGRTLDRLRSQHVRSAHLVYLNPDATRSAQTSAHDRLEYADRRALVGTVLDVLPGSDRATVELALDGLTHTEIAEELGRPLGTVKTQLRRGLHMLRAAASGRPRRPFRWGQTPQPTVAALEAVHVLVVDDEPDTLKLTSLVLRRAGAVVTAAASAAQACARLSSLWPDLALIDLEMPDRDGYDLLRELRARTEADASLPAIAFTASSSAVERRRTASAGFDLHLGKPISPALLVASVARLISAAA